MNRPSQSQSQRSGVFLVHASSMPVLRSPPRKAGLLQMPDSYSGQGGGCRPFEREEGPPHPCLHEINPQSAGDRVGLTGSSHPISFPFTQPSTSMSPLQVSLPSYSKWHFYIMVCGLGSRNLRLFCPQFTVQVPLIHTKTKHNIGPLY